MKYRKFGRTGWSVSEVSLGTWQVGGRWGSGFDDTIAESILNEAVDQGLTLSIPQMYMRIGRVKQRLQGL